MSTTYCLFDLFPGEIVELIFDYLSIIDIMRAFLKLSPHTNKIVSNYNFYKVNLVSILKNEFDLICDNIKPHQIKSLILSDGIDTPFQTNVFFSLFKIEEFSFNLSNLSLIDIDNQSMESIANNLYKLDKLSSLTIINSTLTCPTIFKNVFPQLNRLTISSEWFFKNLIQMDKLQYLIISNQCSFNQLEMLISHAPNLISLNICLERESGGNIHVINSNLTRLIINMSSCQMNFILMKNLLNCFPCLIHFEIECRSDFDLCDGHQWELFILDKFPRLKNFSFKFQLKPSTTLNTIEIQNVLRSFSSLFWLVEKRWFIAIEWGQRLVYSVPRFSCESADPNFRPPIHNTSLDDSIYYDHINALAIWGESNHRFLNVKEVWLVDNPSKIDLDIIIDLNRVERLIFVSSENDLSIEILISLISKMKNLNFIKFSSIPISFNEYEEEKVFRQIRSIELIKELKSFSSILTLNKLFPEIERLNIRIKSNEDIVHVLKTFSNNLSIVKFTCETSILSITKKSFENILSHSNFTCSIDTSSIRLWIGSNKSEEQFQFEEKKHVGCLSWRYLRKVLFKR